MAKQTSVAPKRIAKTVKRKGVISKTKSSSLKNSKNYLKKYKGQGR